MKKIIPLILLACASVAYAQEWSSTYDPATGIETSRRQVYGNEQIIINNDNTGQRIELEQQPYGQGYRGKSSDGMQYHITNDGTTTITGPDGYYKRCYGTGPNRRCY